MDAARFIDEENKPQSTGYNSESGEGLPRVYDVFSVNILALLILVTLPISIFMVFKVIASFFSKHSAVRKISTQSSISKNMKLKTTEPKDSEKRKLAVILSWMLAKESHIDKFCAIYQSRGFDVLTVPMTPKELLFPTSGSQVIAAKLLDFIKDNEQYSVVLIHAFSVGGYLLGEVFVKMQDNEKYKSIRNRIKGVVTDSVADFQSIPAGFPRAVSQNPVVIKVLEWYVHSHLALMHNIATKHYIKASKSFHDPPYDCPVLMFVSEADQVGNLGSHKKAVEKLSKRGLDVKLKTFKDSKHVSHLYQYQDEYTKELDAFFQKTDMIPGKL